MDNKFNIVILVITILVSTFVGDYLNQSIDAPRELARINTSLAYIQADLVTIKTKMETYITWHDYDILSNAIKQNADKIELIMRK